jgi:hypothetical protein
LLLEAGIVGGNRKRNIAVLLFFWKIWVLPPTIQDMLLSDGQYLLVILDLSLYYDVSFLTGVFA